MSADLELRQLRVFVAVVEAETLTLAAEALGVAQSTVSECVASLERALGARVFARCGRSLALTAEGRALLPYAQRMLALEREARAGVAEVGERARSTLVIGAIESVGTYLLPQVLTALRRSWPKLHVDVETGICADVRRWVKDGQVDLGLVLDQPGGRPGDEPVLLRTPLVVFAREVRQGERAATVTEALRKATFFFSDRAGLYHQIVRQHFRAMGFPSPAMHGLGTIEAVKRTVARTEGAYGVLPHFAVADELRSGQLADVPLQPPLHPLELRALRSNPRQPLPPPGQELLERLQGFAGSGRGRTLGGATPAAPAG